MNPKVEKLSQETIYSYETCEFIYDFMGVLGLEQGDCTRKLLHKASGLGEDPIRLMFLMLLYAHQSGNFNGGKK
jgi:hypothetical protein